MTSNYNDFIDAMARAREDTLGDVEKLVLTEESLSTFMTDEELSQEAERKAESLDTFSVTIETGDGDYIVTESGTQYEL